MIAWLLAKQIVCPYLQIVDNLWSLYVSPCRALQLNIQLGAAIPILLAVDFNLPKDHIAAEVVFRAAAVKWTPKTSPYEG